MNQIIKFCFLIVLLINNTCTNTIKNEEKHFSRDKRVGPLAIVPLAPIIISSGPAIVTGVGTTVIAATSGISAATALVYTGIASGVVIVTTGVVDLATKFFSWIKN